MRVLLMTSAEKGHLNPLVGVAQRLMGDGHRVGWLTIPEPAEQLAELGVEVLALEPQGAPPVLVTGGEALARLVLDRDALRRWIRTLLLDAVPGQIEPVRGVLRAFRPDVVAADGMLYQGVIAAALEGVPCAGVSSALTLLAPQDLDIELLATVRALSDDRAALFARYGLRPEFRTCEWLSPLVNVVFATAALVGDDARVPPRTELVGPSRPVARRGDEPEFPWRRLDGRPLVYVSFGSQISWQPELFRTIALAAAPLGAQLVLSAGALAATDFAASLPGAPLLVPYAPQLALLERAAVLVSHGGANSVMEAMDHGVAPLLIPICNDQPVQAHFLAKSGAGLSLKRDEVGVASVRHALGLLLQPDGAQRVHARRVRDSYRARDGAAEAARLIAALGPGG